MSNKTYNWFIKDAQEEEFWAYRPTFSKEQCEEIIKIGKSLNMEEGVVGNNNSIDSTIRKSRISWLPSNDIQTQWIFRACTDMVNELNDKYFKYDLMYIENLQFTEYDGDDGNNSFYGKHYDTMYRNNGSRKLSFSVLLSDENSFVGGDLMLHYAQDPVPGIKQQGTAVAFPSNMLHEVTPVSKGVRYSLVGWVVGPRFR